MGVEAAAEAEDDRAQRLLRAQANARQLFDEVERQNIIAPGVSERQASDAIGDLASELFGVRRHWHKRIVRAGLNTLVPYDKNPRDRLIGDDDIVFCDFGPVFDGWEADFGRTFVVGKDPAKLRLSDDLADVWASGKQHFEAIPDITGEQLYSYVTEEASRHGWQFGGDIAGHLVGKFPHRRIAGEKVESYIAPGSRGPMRRRDSTGNVCHWILEVHLVDRGRQIGGFFEQLLTLG